MVSLPPKHSSNWLSGFAGLHHEGVQQTTTGAKTRLEGSNSCSLCKDLASRAGLEAKESREGGRKDTLLEIIRLSLFQERLQCRMQKEVEAKQPDQARDQSCSSASPFPLCPEKLQAKGEALQRLGVLLFC